LLLVGLGRAQIVSSAQVTLIVPAPAGASSGQVGSVVAEALSRILEVPVHIENIGGDAGVVGTNAIAAGAHDGTLLGLGVSAAIVGGRLLSRNAKFSPIDDFQWFTILGTYPAAMVVAADAPQEHITAWLAAAREAPAPLTYASIGTGSAGHLAGGFLRVAQGARLFHRSVEAPSLRYALLGDRQIDVLFDGVPNARLEAPRSGHRIIAVTSATRAPLLPDVPSFGELWQQSFESWVGLIAPKALKDAAYNRLAAAVGVLLGDTRFQDRLRETGIAFKGLSGGAALAFLDSEIVQGAKRIAQFSEEGMRN
jgi:tripartite-type tricarboxylate transporter receptor subunit TctC